MPAWCSRVPFSSAVHRPNTVTANQSNHAATQRPLSGLSPTTLQCCPLRFSCQLGGDFPSVQVTTDHGLATAAADAVPHEAARGATLAAVAKRWHVAGTGSVSEAEAVSHDLAVHAQRTALEGGLYVLLPGRDYPRNYRRRAERGRPAEPWIQLTLRSTLCVICLWCPASSPVTCRRQLVCAVRLLTVSAREYASRELVDETLKWSQSAPSKLPAGFSATAAVLRRGAGRTHIRRVWGPPTQVSRCSATAACCTTSSSARLRALAAAAAAALAADDADL